MAMNIFYSSDGEYSGFMTLEDLLANLKENEVLSLDYDETGLREELNSRGWCEGTHELGRYLILNCAKFPLKHQAHKINEDI